MAKMKSVVLVKKGAAKMAATGTKPKAADPGAFGLIDNQDDSVTVMGVTTGGDHVDISTVATLAAVSSDPAVASVDPPAGMTYQLHGLKAGHSDVALTVTWNDGSIGPFSATDPIDVASGGVTGLVITHGVPVTR
jgi:hypothetical protein